MESIGQPSEPQPPREKEKYKEPRKFRGQTSASGRAATTGTTVNTDKEETGQSASDTDHAGSGRENRSGAKKSAPVESLVGQIQDIVEKLAALSQQVTEFQQLPAPGITFPISPARHPRPQSPPRTPLQASTLPIPSPAPPSGAHQVPRSKAGQVQRQSPLGPHGHHIPHLSIPTAGMPALGSQTQPATPSKVKSYTEILHDSPINS